MVTRIGKQSERQPRSVRGLSKTSLDKTEDSNTLYFTTSTSSTLQVTDHTGISFGGLYKCTLNAFNEGRENNAGDDQVQCRETRKVANGLNRDGRRHAPWPLHNVHLHNGNREIKKRPQVEGMPTIPPTETRPSYLYANTKIDHRLDDPNIHVGSWEILRAKFPGNAKQNGGDDTVHFESVFRTLDAFDWNECGFKCCPYKANADDDPFQYSDNEENKYFSHTHAYVRTIPRSFAVDKTTGEIFISWEGFYQNCNPASFVEEKMLEWTIGVSRLKTEDPYCTTDQATRMENNFPRCTEPVAMIHQSPTGRDVVLPYGGFEVIPAIDTDHQRSFVLSVLTSPKKGKVHENHLWVVPEGGTRGGEPKSLDGAGTSMDNLYENMWDGGTLRLHYNSQTGKPDHICRSIFDKGIGCMPISSNASGDNRGTVNILPEGEEYMILSQDEVKSFCGHNHASEDPWGRNTPLVTGLEVIWSEGEEDGMTYPQKVIFGCTGGEGSKGNFGMIDINRWTGEISSPMKVIDGAYPGSMMVIPQELEQLLATQSIESSTDASNGTIVPPTIYQHQGITFLMSYTVSITLLLLFSVGFLFYIRRRYSIIYFRKHDHPQSPIPRDKESTPSIVRLSVPYVELQTVDSETEHSQETVDSENDGLMKPGSALKLSELAINHLQAPVL